MAHVKWNRAVVEKLCWRTRKYAIEAAQKQHQTARVAPTSYTEDDHWHSESERIETYLMERNATVDVASELCVVEAPGDASKQWLVDANGTRYATRDVAAYARPGEFETHFFGCDLDPPRFGYQWWPSRWERRRERHRAHPHAAADPVAPHAPRRRRRPQRRRRLDASSSNDNNGAAGGASPTAVTDETLARYLHFCSSVPFMRGFDSDT
mmetsp:Transcript_15250/g.61302  ORF Transcript_15250/g.61302 Transcript_15250/m.61302 type:complete len:210 (+) Transcript_15250:2160-2789(+)